jgi:imidazolonepropionase-like amidohydrolase
VLLYRAILLIFPALVGLSQTNPQAQMPPNVALINGQWFNGKSFAARTVYSVNGRFTSKKPARVDRTLDLTGTWVVPPFGEAHSHSLGTGMEEREREALQKYLSAGVFYVKVQGNLPLTDESKRRLAINRPDGVDVVLAGGGLTATEGHPVPAVERMLQPQGYTRETLNDRRYFTIDSEAELEKKWPLILSFRPDFIKTLLLYSDEFERRRGDPAYAGRKALDPRLLPKIVAKAHESKLRVSTHINTAADFHHAVAAGVDEVTHLPPLRPRSAGDKSLTPISVEDARLTARRGIVVITTVALSLNAPEDERAQLRQVQTANLKLLREHGVAIAIGSDGSGDSLIKEVEYLQGLGVFDNSTLLKMWTETTAKTIFPQRKIGALKLGYEASFLALEGNPLEDLQNVRKIKLRFKQGFLLEP